MKKVISTIVLIMSMLFCISSNAFAESNCGSIEYVFKYYDNYKSMMLTSKDNNCIITVSVGYGYKCTSVCYDEKNQYEIYISDYNDTYIDIDQLYSENNIDSLLDYSADTFIGLYTQESNENVYSDSFIYRYTSPYTDSYMRHYNNDRYEVKYMGSSKSYISSSRSIYNLSYDFVYNVEDLDTTLIGIMSSALGFIPGVSQMISFTDIANNLNRNRGLTGSDLINALNIAVSSVPGMSSFCAVASLSSNVILAVTHHVNAKNDFNAL